MMLEHTFKGRRARDVTHQADRRGVEISGDRHALFFSSLDHRRNREVIAEGLATAAVDVPHGGADLGVAIAVDFLFEKVDEAPVTLKYRQDAEIRARWGLREERLDPRREIGIGEDTPEGPKGQSDSVQVFIPVSGQLLIVCGRLAF
jgi:hypothetical protein